MAKKSKECPHINVGKTLEFWKCLKCGFFLKLYKVCSCGRVRGWSWPPEFCYECSSYPHQAYLRSRSLVDKAPAS